MSREGYKRVRLQVESSPLLDAKPAAGGAGTASVPDVVAYICKVCIGTGILALPFAVVKGGTVFTPVGLLLIAIWNYVCADRLLRCGRALGLDVVGPDAMYAHVGERAFGALGQLTVQLMYTLTFLGASTTYQITSATLLAATLPAKVSARVLTLLLGIAFVPAAFVKELGFLSMISIAGLAALLVGVLAVFVHGLVRLAGSDGADEEKDDEATAAPLSFFPTSLSNFSTFFGITVYCFGVVPLVFQIQGGMKEPSRFVYAFRLALGCVLAAYVCVSESVALVYARLPGGVPDNMLLAVESSSVWDVLIRVAVALTCALSYPLTFVPVVNALKEHFSSTVLQHVPAWVIGVLTIGLTTLLAVLIPCLGLAVAIVGCFAVAMVSFVLPPCFRLALCWQDMALVDKVADIALTVLGAVTCLFTTAMTIHSISQQLQSGEQCQ